MTSTLVANSHNLANSSTKKEIKFPEDVQVILRADKIDRGNLFMGNIEAAKNVQILQYLRVQAIVTAAKGQLLKHPKDIVPYTKYIPLQDDSRCDLYDFLDSSSTFIADMLKKTNVLVHCVAGVSRSAALVIAYFMKERGLTLEEAFNQVKARRMTICPSANILEQLKEYETELSNKIIRKNTSTPYKSIREPTQSKSFVMNNGTSNIMKTGSNFLATQSVYDSKSKRSSHGRNKSSINIEVLAPKDQIIENPEDGRPGKTGKRCGSMNKDVSFVGSNRNKTNMSKVTQMNASFVSGRMTTQRKQTQLGEEPVQTENSRLSKLSDSRKSFSKKMSRIDTINAKINDRLDLIQDSYESEVRIHKNNLEHQLNQIYKAKADLYDEYQRQRKNQGQKLLHDKTMEDETVRQYIHSNMADRY